MNDLLGWLGFLGEGMAEGTAEAWSMFFALLFFIATLVIAPIVVLRKYLRTSRANV